MYTLTQRPRPRAGEDFSSEAGRKRARSLNGRQRGDGQGDVAFACRVRQRGRAVNNSGAPCTSWMTTVVLPWAASFLVSRTGGAMGGNVEECRRREPHRLLQRRPLTPPPPAQSSTLWSSDARLGASVLRAELAITSFSELPSATSACL